MSWGYHLQAAELLDKCCLQLMCWLASCMSRGLEFWHENFCLHLLQLTFFCMQGCLVRALTCLTCQAHA